MTLLWASDLTQVDNVAAGWQADTGGNRDTSSGLDAASGLVRPIRVTTAPDGERALLVTLPEQGHRNELLPGHAKFGEGASAFFSLSIWVPTGFPDANVGSYYQVVEQMRQASYNGSPPVCLEVRGGALILSGGAGMGASGTPDQYKFEKYLRGVLPYDRWAPLTYSLTNFSATPATTKISVWLGREPLLSAWTLPTPTIVPPPAGQTGNSDGLTYRKMGLYHWSGNPAASLWYGPARYGTTFADVDLTDYLWREPRRTRRPVGAV